MSEAPTIAVDRTATIGPGRLILVVGPSGAGKDTLLGLARAACAEDCNIVFPRRVVTREASAFEDNEPINRESFARALADGAYAMHWEAHGHCYGLPRAIDDDIRAGRTVIVNVSRTVISAMRAVYADVVVVSITAPPDVLAERLGDPMALLALPADQPPVGRMPFPLPRASRPVSKRCAALHSIARWRS